MSVTKTSRPCVAKASLHNIRMSPRRARLVVDMVRNKTVPMALRILSGCSKKPADPVRKLILSAVANAKENASVDVDNLFVDAVWVDEGRKLKRFMPRAQGRATPIRKRSSRISLVLSDIS